MATTGRYAWGGRPAIGPAPRLAARRPRGAAQPPARSDHPDRDGLPYRPAARTRRPLRPVPRWTLPLLPLVGAAAAGAVGLVAAGFLTMGAGGSASAAVLRVCGLLAFLVAPSAGVPLTAYLAHRRLGRPLHLAGVGLTLFGGMVAATALSLSFFTR